MTLKEKILETWIISDKINTCTGLTTDSNEQLDHQINIAASEFKEGVLAIKDNNETEKYDCIADLHVTVVSCATMYAENKDLLNHEYPYELNPDGSAFDELFYEAKYEFESTVLDVRHFTTCLDILCDLTAASDIDEDKMIAYLDAVNESNLSKFPEVGSVDPEKQCQWIEDQGRYTDVYFEEGELSGKQVYIFKSKYDKKNNERFPSGKYLKPEVFRDVQQILNQE